MRQTIYEAEFLILPRSLSLSFFYFFYFSFTLTLSCANIGTHVSLNNKALNGYRERPRPSWFYLQPIHSFLVKSSLYTTHTHTAASNPEFSLLNTVFFVNFYSESNSPVWITIVANNFPLVIVQTQKYYIFFLFFFSTFFSIYIFLNHFLFILFLPCFQFSLPGIQKKKKKTIKPRKKI